MSGVVGVIVDVSVVGIGVVLCVAIVVESMSVMVSLAVVGCVFGCGRVSSRCQCSVVLGCDGLECLRQWFCVSVGSGGVGRVCGSCGGVVIWDWVS